jgi:hypothetical protein
MKSNLNDLLKLAVYYVIFNLILFPASISLYTSLTILFYMHVKKHIP